MPRRRNQAIKSYNLKDGKERFNFSIYAGINPATGKQRNINRRGFTSYEAANEAYNQIQGQLDTGTFFKDNAKQKNQMTFQEVYELWWKTYVNTVRPTTAQKTKSWFELRILPEFGRYKIAKITPAQVQTAVNKWSAQVVRYKTYMRYTNRVFHYALVLDQIDSNPVDRIIIPAKGKESIRDSSHNFWEPEQLKQFIHYLDNESIETLALFRTLALTGVRRGELLALSWRDLDLTEGLVHVKHSVYYDKESHIMKMGQPKSKAGVRYVYLDAKTIAILKDWRFAQRMQLGRGRLLKLDQLVFPGKSNRIMYADTLNERFDQLIKKFGLPRITPHGLRHTYATWLYETDPSITPKDMQRVLGHENSQVTMDVYTHSTDEGQRAVERFMQKIDF